MPFCIFCILLTAVFFLLPFWCSSGCALLRPARGEWQSAMAAGCLQEWGGTAEKGAGKNAAPWRGAQSWAPAQLPAAIHAQHAAGSTFSPPPLTVSHTQTHAYNQSSSDRSRENNTSSPLYFLYTLYKTQAHMCTTNIAPFHSDIVGHVWPLFTTC